MITLQVWFTVSLKGGGQLTNCFNAYIPRDIWGEIEYVNINIIKISDFNKDFKLTNYIKFPILNVFGECIR